MSHFSRGVVVFLAGLIFVGELSAQVRAITPKNAQVVKEMVLVKELDAYPNYGVNGAADILYAGDIGTWTFILPTGLARSTATPPYVRVFFALDDHDSVSVAKYTTDIEVNGMTVHAGPLAAQHGNAFAGRFTNWIASDFRITLAKQGTANVLSIQNSSMKTKQGHWFAIDRVELHLPLRTP